jgi:hypothetical protein
MSSDDEFGKTIGDNHIAHWGLVGLLDSLDPFVAAPFHMVCEECDEFIPLDEHGFNYEHCSLDPSVIRDDYATLVVRLLPARMLRGTPLDVRENFKSKPSGFRGLFV